MGLLDGKKGIVFGVANDRSYAWYIAQALVEQGAQCAFTHLPDEKGKMARRCRKAVEEMGVSDPWLEPCDVSKDEDLDHVFSKLGEGWGQIDFVIHSVAFAQREYLATGNFHQTSRQAWQEALDISAYSLVGMAQRAKPIMPEGGSIVAMSYYGGEKVVPGYNVMGIAKAALEHSARYLALELGEQGIRVNAISGGPLKTLAASAVGGIDDMFAHQEKKAPLGRNISGEEVGRTAAYLVSDWSSGVTGETIHVDAGFNTVGL